MMAKKIVELMSKQIKRGIMNQNNNDVNESEMSVESAGSISPEDLHTLN